MSESSSEETESVSSREIEESSDESSSVESSVPVESTPVEPTPPVETPTEPASTYYVVQQGDSWYGIATSYGIDVYTLAQANGATIDTPIFPGMEILIP